MESDHNGQVRLAMVSANHVFLKGVEACAKETEDIRFCGSIGESTMQHTLETHDPDVVLIDTLSIPSPTVIQKLLAAREDLRCIVIRNTILPPTAHLYLIHRVKGFLESREEPEVYLNAVRAVNRGKVWMNKRLRASLLHMKQVSVPHESEKTRMGFSALSDNQMAILTSMERGMSDKDMASTMGLSHKTIETHKEKMKAKLHLKGNRELLRAALELRVNRPLLESAACLDTAESHTLSLDETLHILYENVVAK